MNLRYRVLVVCLITITINWLVAQQPGSGDKKVGRWVENKFEDFIKGDFWTQSANLYVSRSGRMQSVYRWDINKDGYIDILFSQAHENNESPDCFLYLDSAAKQSKRVDLEARGAFSVKLADLNGDGYLEAIIANGDDGETFRLWSHIYWGGSEGYSRSRRTELPTPSARDVEVADINKDGYPDLIFALKGTSQYGEGDRLLDFGEKDGWSIIFWGSKVGYDLDDKQLVPTIKAIDVGSADLNKDGFPDLVFVNERERDNIFVYFGSEKGIASKPDLVWTVDGAKRVTLGDVDGDGLIDTVVSSSRSAQIIFGKDLKSPIRQTLAITQSTDCAIADLNKDDKIDLVFSLDQDDHSVILWNMGGDSYRQETLPTYHAQAVKVYDINKDGYPDIVFCNQRNEETKNIPSYVYWGSPRGFSVSHRKEFQTQGALNVAVGDVDKNGTVDLLFSNEKEGRVESFISSFLYWGNPQGQYSPANRVELLGHGPYGTSVTDLNDDGYNDIVFSNYYVTPGKPLEGVYIYWGGPHSYSTARMQVLPIEGVMTHRVADLNRDGYLDLVFPLIHSSNYLILWGSANGFSLERKMLVPSPGPGYDRCRNIVIADFNKDGFPDMLTSFETKSELVLYWGAADGFSNKRLSRFRAASYGFANAADLNNDGYLDLIVPSIWKDRSREDYSAKSFVFWGGPEGFDASRSQRVSVSGTARCTIQDFNGDGYLDIAFASYYANDTRSDLYVPIFWGSQDGFYSDKNRARLPIDSSNGFLAADLNGDGYMDLVVSSHKRFGNHVWRSPIFWGGPQGFSLDRTTWLPTKGPNGITTDGTDIGNVYTRKLEEFYVSSAFNCGAKSELKQIFWDAETPNGTNVKFQIRTASTKEGLVSSPWEGWFGPGSYYTVSGSPIQGITAGQNWVQYRAVFTSPNGGDTAVLKEVRIAYESPAAQ